MSKGSKISLLGLAAFLIVAGIITILLANPVNAGGQIALLFILAFLGGIVFYSIAGSSDAGPIPQSKSNKLNKRYSANPDLNDVQKLAEEESRRRQKQDGI